MNRPIEARGFTLIELLVVVAIVGILAAIAVPGLLRSRVSANEASAIASMRAILSAQQDFAALDNGFADDLATLASTCPGATQPFISPDLGSNGVTKSGFTFAVVAGSGAVAGPLDCFGAPTQSTYYATASPISVAATGNFAFAANPTAVIWQDSTGVPPSEPFTVSPTVRPLSR